MDTKYIIEEQTLASIAESIRHIEGSANPIPVEEFAPRVGAFDLSTVEYMGLMDLIDGVQIEYSEEEINKVEEYMNKFGGDLEYGETL